MQALYVDNFDGSISVFDGDKRSWSQCRKMVRTWVNTCCLFPFFEIKNLAFLPSRIQHCIHWKKTSFFLNKFFSGCTFPYSVRTLSFYDCWCDALSDVCPKSWLLSVHPLFALARQNAIAQDYASHWHHLWLRWRAPWNLRLKLQTSSSARTFTASGRRKVHGEQTSLPYTST